MPMNVKLGVIGLGKIGGNLSLRAVDRGVRVFGKSRSPKPELQAQGVTIVDNYPSLVSSLEHPRIIYLSLPAGVVIDEVLNVLAPLLEKQDVILDGGNSFYLDSIERASRLWKENQLYFLDCGTSGGLEGARSGACFMVGGSADGYKIVEPILKVLALNDDACLYTGKSGSGHFVKLVHNGIEFGMLESIAEGLSLLLNGNDFELSPARIFKNWSNGSVIRGWLIELMEKGLEYYDLSQVQSCVEDTGEVNWLLQYAINKEIPIPIISQSIMELFKSRIKEMDVYKAIALMRHEFGGHPFGRDEKISKERKNSRITKI
jgi:6-phosphogluconate dehydrogenase